MACNHYFDGFCSGFMARNADVVDPGSSSHKLIFKHSETSGGVVGDEIGDIDASYVLKTACTVSSLFPVGALVQIDAYDDERPADSRLFFELMASQGETLVRACRQQEPKLLRKIKFYNTLSTHYSETLRPQDFVMFVYDGEEPVAVKQYYNLQERLFRGCVVHFGWDKVIKWEGSERQKQLESEVQRLQGELEELRRRLEQA